MTRCRTVGWMPAAIAVATGVSGCAGNEASLPEARAGLVCVDDSMDCIGKRQATLRALVNDSGRSWVKEPVTPEAYASGVRLFAFKTKKKELSCDELAQGRREADAAPASLKSVGNLLTPAQVARSKMLAGEIGRELDSEFNRRCKKG